MKHRGDKQASRLSQKLEALNEARELAEGVLAEDAVDSVFDVLDRAASRRSFSADHTVVGFFGATGSGKSSLFNAVNGKEVATAAARRPTTSEPLASVWGVEGSESLLDWLDVGRRHHADPVPGFADESTGLILLDLPDFDSTAEHHRAVVERMVGMVDVMVWVLDPQKYADDALHAGFLRRLGSHGAVTLVVLNQVDKLREVEVPGVLDSLKGLLAAEGLGGVRVLASSALTGRGVDSVRVAIKQVIDGRRAVAERLEADVSQAAARLAEASGEGEPVGVRAESVKTFGAELASAAGVPLVMEAVAKSYRREAVKRTGWPLTRWLVRLGKDPLQRLHLGGDRGPAEVSRSSLPPASAASRARSDAAVRTFVDGAADGAPGPWLAAVRTAGREGRERLPDAVDQAIAGADLGAARRSWWWGVLNVVQWLALLVALGGALWLGALALLGYLQMPVLEVPRVEGWPIPTLMILAGVLCGVVLALVGKPFAAFGARRRARRAGRTLGDAVLTVAQREVVEPVATELARLSAFRAALERARRG